MHIYNVYMHLTGALLAPAFDEVDAYISYTVSLYIQYIV